MSGENKWGEKNRYTIFLKEFAEVLIDCTNFGLETKCYNSDFLQITLPESRNVFETLVDTCSH